MRIQEITTHDDPIPFVAVKIDKGIYQVNLLHFFTWVFNTDKPLKQYYKNGNFNEITLYKDLLTLDYPIQDKLIEYIQDTDLLLIPHNIYPSILRYYSDRATYTDIILLSAFFGIDGQHLERGDLPL